jgi:hypothetical protein
VPATPVPEPKPPAVVTAQTLRSALPGFVFSGVLLRPSAHVEQRGLYCRIRHIGRLICLMSLEGADAGAGDRCRIDSFTTDALLEHRQWTGVYAQAAPLGLYA